MSQARRQHASSEEHEHEGYDEPARRQPASGGSALLIAGLVASWLIYSGYSKMDDSSSCDGGSCALSLVFGVVHGAIAFVIVLPIAWAVLSRLRRGHR